MHLLELLKITNVRERKISNEEGEREKVFGCTNSEVRYICIIFISTYIINCEYVLLQSEISDVVWWALLRVYVLLSFQTAYIWRVHLQKQITLI